MPESLSSRYIRYESQRVAAVGSCDDLSVKLSRCSRGAPTSPDNAASRVTYLGTMEAGLNLERNAVEREGTGELLRFAAVFHANFVLAGLRHEARRPHYCAVFGKSVYLPCLTSHATRTMGIDTV